MDALDVLILVLVTLGIASAVAYAFYEKHCTPGSLLCRKPSETPGLAGAGPGPSELVSRPFYYTDVTTFYDPSGTYGGSPVGAPYTKGSMLATLDGAQNACAATAGCGYTAASEPGAAYGYTLLGKTTDAADPHAIGSQDELVEKLNISTIAPVPTSLQAAYGRFVATDTPSVASAPGWNLSVDLCRGDADEARAACATQSDCVGVMKDPKGCYHLMKDGAATPATRAANMDGYRELVWPSKHKAVQYKPDTNWTAYPPASEARYDARGTLCNAPASEAQEDAINACAVTETCGGVGKFAGQPCYSLLSPADSANNGSVESVDGLEPGTYAQPPAEMRTAYSILEPFSASVMDLWEPQTSTSPAGEICDLAASEVQWHVEKCEQTMAGCAGFMMMPNGCWHYMRKKKLDLSGDEQANADYAKGYKETCTVYEKDNQTLPDFCEPFECENGGIGDRITCNRKNYRRWAPMSLADGSLSYKEGLMDAKDRELNIAALKVWKTEGNVSPSVSL